MKSKGIERANAVDEDGGLVTVVGGFSVARACPLYARELFFTYPHNIDCIEGVYCEICTNFCA